MSASRFHVGGVKEHDRQAKCPGAALDDAAGPTESERGNLRVGRTGSDELAEGHARMRAREDPSQQRRVRRGPAVCLRRRRHVDELEELTVFVQHGDRTVRAGINSEDGLGGHFLRS